MAAWGPDTRSAAPPPRAPLDDRGLDLGPAPAGAPTKLEIALAHAERGRRVFPFRLTPRPDGKFDKVPLTGHGHLNATTGLFQRRDRSAAPLLGGDFSGPGIAYYWRQVVQDSTVDL
jgi:hypothetical protein